MHTPGYLAITLLISVAFTGFSSAEETAKPIDGDFRLTEGQCGDRAAPCSINFEVRGQLARTMYDHMPATPQHDKCSDAELKWDGNGLSCYKAADGNFFCDFGYDFAAGRLVQSDVSC